MYVFFFKQKTAYEMRISDWSSDVCSSDLSAAATLSRRRRNRKYSRKDCSAITCPKLIGPPLAWGIQPAPEPIGPERSEERRVGKECVSTCRSRWSRYH